MDDPHIQAAVHIARQATCLRSKCGSVIVKDGIIIGAGYNSPPANQEKQRRCHHDKNVLDKKITDKTCCVHAEQRAILDALKNHPEKITGSTLYFIRLDEHDNPSVAGQPYCTICSKMALDVGILNFVLLHAKGLTFYNTAEYNLLSYQYQSNG